MGYSSFFTGAEEIKGSTTDCTASPASKAFNESRPRRLMSLALSSELCRETTVKVYLGS